MLPTYRCYNLHLAACAPGILSRVPTLTHRTLFLIAVLLALLPSVSRAAGDTYVHYALSTGNLYIPSGYHAPRGQLDLIVHFHGADDVVKENLTQSGKSAALVVINYPGLSSAYQQPFSDPALFSRILGEARQKVSQQLGQPLRIRRLVLSSFSAGYAAVREILKSSRYFGLVTDIVLADSLYASYTMVNGQRVPDPTQMRNFIAFAQRSAGAQGTMILTHSQLVPGTYASTIETADVLIQAAGATRVPASGVDAAGMALESKADRGRFHVRSYQGTTGEDHLNHLRQMQEAYKLTSLLPV